MRSILQLRSIQNVLGLLLGASLWTAVAAQTASLVVHADKGQHQISRHIYGHFAEHLGRCIYEGIWVGEDSPIPNVRGIRTDVVEALKRMKIPVLRWPGGCFADEYHWKDGIGPREQRPAMINTHWGGVVENNHFGTHEFLDLCEQLGTEPYVCGNVGSGSVQEMMEWVEYMTSDADSPMANLRRRNGREQPWKVRYFGVGNESWGCGGNMTPEYYADQFRRYNTFVKDYSGNRVYRIACGPNGGDYRWTEVLMDKVGHRMNGLSLHHYTIPTGDWGRKGSATEFGEDQYHGALRRALQMDELIRRHGEIMDRRDPQKRIGLIVDEWGIWTDVEPGTNPGFLYQQNSLRDALIAALTLNIFNQHGDRVKMANIAQTINVLQAVILTDRERMILTPTYHVFEMYAVHQDATMLPVDVQGEDYVFGRQRLPRLHASASRDAAGVIHVSLCNLHPAEAVDLDLSLPGVSVKSAVPRVLTADTIQSHNTFDQPDVVRPRMLATISVNAGKCRVTLPAKSVTVLALQ